MPLYRDQPWCSLHTPDDQSWPRLLGYNRDLARHLRRAYAILRDTKLVSHPSESTLWVYATLQPYRDRWVCSEQRLRLLYALALTCYAEGMYEQTAELATEAIDLADHMGDISAQVELGHLAGTALHMAGHNDRSFWAYTHALFALRALERDGVSVDSQLELDLVQRCAWRAWELGVLSAAVRGLHEGYALLSVGVPDCEGERANLAWLDAQISRLQGQVARAVDMARTAASIWDGQGNHINTGRIFTIWAECALDAAEVAWWIHVGRSPRSALPFYVPDPDAKALNPHALLTVAVKAAREGIVVARENEDAAGKAMGRLALRRARRLQSGMSTAAAMHELEQLLQEAQRGSDLAIVGRVETALGDELVLRDRTEAAALAYYRAQMVYEEHEFGALARWPRIALARMDS